MLRIIAAALFALLFSSAGFAQQAKVVTNCAGMSPQYDAGGVNLLTMAPDGTLCSGGSSGGAGRFDTTSATVTRPADTTAYASGDIICASTTAGSCTPMTLAVARIADKGFAIFRVRLSKTNTSTTNASFRVHLYRTSPTPTNGDNGAWLTTNSTYMGCFDVTMDKAFSDAAKGVGTPCTGNQIIGLPSSGTQNIFAVLEARAAYTPASGETFTLTTEQSED
jgi:hypothetical protein